MTTTQKMTVGTVSGQSNQNSLDYYDNYYDTYGDYDSCCGEALKGTKYKCKNSKRTDFCNLKCFDYEPGMDLKDWVCKKGVCKPKN